MFNFPGVVDKTPRKSAPPAAPPERHALGDIDLRGWRKKCGKTLAFVAGRVGSDIKNLSEIERATGSNAAKTRLKWAPLYAGALEISFDKMLLGLDAPPTLGERVDAAPPEIQRLIEQMLELRMAPTQS